MNAVADMVTQLQWAWLAGMIDGDGCIRTQSRDGATLFVRIGTRREETAEHLKATYGGSVYRGKSRMGRPFWTWDAGSKWLSENLEQLIPYLVEKKAQAIVALELLTLRRQSRG